MAPTKTTDPTKPKKPAADPTDADSSEDVKPKPAAKPKPGATPVVAKKQTPLEVLTAFLAEHAIEDKAALDAFAKCKISSLADLLDARADDAMRKELEEALGSSGSKFGLQRFRDLQTASIKNAQFFAMHPEGKATSKAVVDFLAGKEVLADSKHRDKLLGILLEEEVGSLAALQKVKAGGAVKAARLTAAIAAMDAESGRKFDAITAADVARGAATAPAKVDEELQAFLKDKAKLPSGSEEVLAEFGVTSLEQLKAIKEDPDQAEELAKKLEDSGIRKAKESFDKIKPEEIDE
ncbi:MAG TPA: hypothetical protein VGD62_05810, partial [Acidobacteriaceae bacterium]